MTPKYSCLIDEQQWMSHIRELILEKDTEDGNGDEEDIQMASIFDVPTSLRCNQPDCYTPQVVSLGPYHRNSPHLLEMERSKLALAKTGQQRHLLLESVEHFQALVDRLKPLDSRVRACYHNRLGFTKEMLSWMMAIDAAFLLHFLQDYAVTQPPHPYGGRRWDHMNAIARDVVMLENQIPLLVLRRMADPELEHSLQPMLVGLCKRLSPFKTEQHMHHQEALASDSAHVLDFLYRRIVDVVEPERVMLVSAKDEEDDDDGTRARAVEILLRFKKGAGWLLRMLLPKIALALPLIVYCHLPALALLKDSLFSVPHDGQQQEPVSCSALPLVDEITIPSVVELSNSGIAFVPTEGGISAISFDTKTGEFRLPAITLDVNSEAVLRNLVAYEAGASSSGPLQLARYTELMNGIIDSEEDARLLRDRGVILSRLKSDGEVARMWNGMAKSVRPAMVPHLDRVIKDVNAYYDGCWRVRFGKIMEAYVFGSWRLLTFVAALMFLFLMSLQVFSSVFNSATKPIIRSYT